MPRRPREEEADAVVHVFARGNDRRAIFLDDLDRDVYLGMLGRVVARQGWRCLAYCLMSNHVHLLVETPQPNLGSGMQRLQSVYAQTFNERHDRVGHVFQGRYGAVRARDDGQVRTAAAYIARNPVVAGQCRRPEDWRWSSHGALSRGRQPHWLDLERLLEHFDAVGGEPMQRYEDLVREGVRPLESEGLKGSDPIR